MIPRWFIATMLTAAVALNGLLYSYAGFMSSEVFDGLQDTQRNLADAIHDEAEARRAADERESEARRMADLQIVQTIHALDLRVTRNEEAIRNK